MRELIQNTVDIIRAVNEQKGERSNTGVLTHRLHLKFLNNPKFLQYNYEFCRTIVLMTERLFYKKINSLLTVSKAFLVFYLTIISKIYF